MKRLVVILTLITTVMTMVYHLSRDNAQTGKEGKAVVALPALESSPLLKFQKPAKSAIADFAVWDLKPFVPLGQMLSLKDMFKPVYALTLKNRVHVLQRSDRSNQGWEFQGLLLSEQRPRAIFNNSETNKIKKVGVGDLLDEQLAIAAIGSGTVTVAAKDGVKQQLFEMRLFNRQKIEASKSKIGRSNDRRESSGAHRSVDPSIRERMQARSKNIANQRRNNDANQTSKTGAGSRKLH